MPHKASAAIDKIKKKCGREAYLFRFGHFPIKLELGYGCVGSYLFPRFSLIYEIHRK